MRFAGYAALFDRADASRDTIRPGAFARTLAERTGPPGMRASLREGCDKRLTTCARRFGNAINFQGEPYLPGNDLLARYPVAS